MKKKSKRKDYGQALEKLVSEQFSKDRAAGLSNILKLYTPTFLSPGGIVRARSTVDFSGYIKGGISVHLEVKGCARKGKFPIVNIKLHQTEYLLHAQNLGCIALFLIHMSHHNAYFLVPPQVVKNYEDETYIPYTVLESEGRRIALPELCNEIRKSGELSTQFLENTVLREQYLNQRGQFQN